MRAGLLMCKCCDNAAVDQIRNERFLRIVACVGDSPSDDQRAEERFDHKAASEALEHDGDIEAVAAEAALGLAEQRADNAQFSELAPQFAAKSHVAARELVARLEAVLFADKPVQRIRQHAAVFGMLKIHGERPLTVP